MNKTGHNAIIFTGDNTIGNNGYVKYRKISNIGRFLQFIDKKYPKWIFANLYNRQTNEKQCIKKSRMATGASGKDKHFFSAGKSN